MSVLLSMTLISDPQIAADGLVEFDRHDERTFAGFSLGLSSRDLLDSHRTSDLLQQA